VCHLICSIYIQVKEIAMNYVKMLAMITIAALGSGCGSEHETNVPAVKLTASAVVSQTDSSSHVHTVTIPFTDVSASPASDSYSYTSDTINSHYHVIAISKQQMADFNNGMRLTLTSSASSSGTSHSHTWNLRGGDLLYEKYCYNCHSNDKRSHNPMNVSFNSSQTSAVKSPASAVLSTSPAAVPSLTPAPPATVDGAALYAANCAACHGALASTNKKNASSALIQAGITGNKGGMGSLGALTDSQLQAIATALAQ
jgi:mono/diheme cytochrome c family protein